MTKTDLFRLIIKIGGLYLLTHMLFNYVSFFFILINDNPPINVLLSAIALLLFAVIFLAMIFKTDLFIKPLKLDKGFDNDTVVINPVEFSSLLKITILFFGLFLIIRQLPSFITNLLFLFKLLVQNSPDTTDHYTDSILHDYIGWAVKIVSLIIGYLMVSNHTAIARYIVKTDSKNQKQTHQ